jgi:hypothetical protein
MNLTRLMSLSAFIIILTFLGCRHSAVVYVLHRNGPDAVISPPLRSTDTAEPIFVAIKNARRDNTKSDCDITGDVISLRWQGRSADVTFHPQAFFADSPEQTESGRRLYLDPIVALDNFRLALTDSQSRGCLQPAENYRLRRSIVENVSLPPAVAYILQMGSYATTGYFDLTADFRIQIQNPFYRPGKEQSADSLLGYETATYAFISAGSEGRTRLKLTSASETLNGMESVEKKTLRRALPLPTSAGYFGLIFMAEKQSASHVTPAIFLSATDVSKFSEVLRNQGKSSEDFCTTMTASGVNCIIVPRNYGITLELQVRVNERNVFIPAGGMLQDALKLEHPENGPPPSLQVLRPFHGHLIPIRFDPTSQDILKLVLLPDDRILF